MVTFSIKNNFMEEHYAIKCIKRALVNDRNTKMMVAIFAIGFGVWLLYYNWQANKAWFLGIAALTALVTGFRLWINVLQYWKVNQMPLLFLLNNQPIKIVWVYSVLTVFLPFGVQWARRGTMYFKLENGDELTIRLLEADIPKVAKYLNTKLPHATFGYTQEREQWYMASPLLLIRDDYEYED
jgi:hypothetical protein